MFSFICFEDYIIQPRKFNFNWPGGGGTRCHLCTHVCPQCGAHALEGFSKSRSLLRELPSAGCFFFFKIPFPIADDWGGGMGPGYFLNLLRLKVPPKLQITRWQQYTVKDETFSGVAWGRGKCLERIHMPLAGPFRLVWKRHAYLPRAGKHRT